MRVIVCGGGAIGTSVAAFLSRRGAETILVERTGIACAASGKSGGFLALDWCDGTPLQALARRSFTLHAELAETLGEDFGFRRMTTYGGAASARGGGGGRAGMPVGWVAEGVTLRQRLGTTKTTAQVHPALFTAAMMRAAEARGARLVRGTVNGIARNAAGAAVGAIVDGTPIASDAVVIDMGPWSVLAAQWLPLPPVFGLKGHSLVFAPETAIPADALFLEFDEANGATSTPEVFPRADGTVYVCAIPSESPVPLDPAAVAPDPGVLARLEAMCRAISPHLRDAGIVARQACFRPVTQDGLPLIGAVPGADGAMLATGHSVWGILNAPGTGEALTELILDGAAEHVDLSPFDPARLPPLDPSALRTG